MIGRSVSNYEIRSLIGEGGMGWVYLAEHPIIGRKAAVKVLRRAFAEDDALVARFIEQTRAVNALRHPHIVDIIDVGRMDDGLPYLLMEYLEGETLRERLRRKLRLPLADVLSIIAPLASALTAAHDKKIVHADLKPENVFLALDGDAPRIKLLDFGVAGLRGDQSGSAKTGGALLGTPVYMSPEQCRGHGAELDARTDVYALGTMVYEMLCGRPPFQSEAQGEVFVMQLMLQPAPPRSLLPELPAAVEAVILRALSKSPAERYLDTNELIWALETAAVAPPEAATPAPGTPTPSPRFEVPPAALPTPTPAADDLPSVKGVIVSEEKPPATAPVEPPPLPSMTLAPSLAPLAVVSAPRLGGWSEPGARLRGRRLTGALAGGMALLAAVLVWSRWHPSAGPTAPPVVAPPPAPARELSALRPPPPPPPLPTPDPIVDLPARHTPAPVVIADGPASGPRPALRPRARRAPPKAPVGPRIRGKRPADNSWMEKW